MPFYANHLTIFSEQGNAQQKETIVKTRNCNDDFDNSRNEYVLFYFSLSETFVPYSFLSPSHFFTTYFYTV
jgi:hypothetical protein